MKMRALCFSKKKLSDDRFRSRFQTRLCPYYHFQPNRFSIYVWISSTGNSLVKTPARMKNCLAFPSERYAGDWLSVHFTINTLFHSRHIGSLCCDIQNLSSPFARPSIIIPYSAFCKAPQHWQLIFWMSHDPGQIKVPPPRLAAYNRTSRNPYATGCMLLAILFVNR